jgi:hypothetical protein
MYFLKQWVSRRMNSAWRLVLQLGTARPDACFSLSPAFQTGQKISANNNRSAQQRGVSGATDRTI